MKKFYSFLVAAVVLMVATSCQKEAVENGFMGENAEFTASIASGRTELGDGNKVMWNFGDNIRIYTQENLAGTVFESDVEETAATATFTTTENFAASENGYLAVYPENAYYDNGFTTKPATYADGVWSVPVKMVGSTIHGVPDGQFAERQNVMVAFSKDNTLQFKAATALLKIKSQGESYGAFEAYGTNLNDAATLLYNTENNEVSCTLTGSGDTRIDFDYARLGATAYLTIFPGTVTGFAVYDGTTKVAEYTESFTFEAGVIYNLDVENAGGNGGDEEDVLVESSWMIMDNTTWAMISMYVKDDYHVAKDVTIGTNGINFNGWDEATSTSSMLGMRGEFELGKWIATADANSGAEDIVRIATGGINEKVDVYLSADASMFCIVPAGETMPALPEKEVSTWLLSTDMGVEVTMYVDDNGFHYAKNVPAGSYWICPNDFSLSYGVSTDYVDAGTWYKTTAVAMGVYSLWLEEPMHVYLSPSADQVCLVWPGSEVPELPQDEPTTTTYLKPNADWNTADAWFAAYYYNNESDYVWVKAVDTDSDGTYECSVNGTYTNVTFCRMNPGYDTMEWGTSEENRIWNKVEGLTVPTTEENCCYVIDWNAGEWNILNYTWSVKENCLYLKPSANWKEASARFAAYFFGNGNTWVDMKRVGYEGYYEVEIPAGYTSVIFCRFNPASTTNGWTSDKWGQTADLTIPTNGNNLYTIVGWGGSGSGSAWSTLE